MRFAMRTIPGTRAPVEDGFQDHDRPDNQHPSDHDRLELPVARISQRVTVVHHLFVKVGDVDPQHDQARQANEVRHGQPKHVLGCTSGDPLSNFA